MTKKADKKTRSTMRAKHAVGESTGEEQQAARDRRDKIARSYKHEVPVQKVLASDPEIPVESDSTITKGPRIMTQTLTLKGISKSGKYALYKGLRTVIRIATTNFPDSQPVPSFTAEGEFAGPRQVMTAEERKAARKNAPKLTAAQKAEKLRKRLAKLEAQAATELAQPVGV